LKNNYFGLNVYLFIFGCPTWNSTFQQHFGIGAYINILHHARGALIHSFRHAVPGCCIRYYIRHWIIWCRFVYFIAYTESSYRIL